MNDNWLNDPTAIGQLCDRLHVAVRGALLSTIAAHGAITRHNLGSAEKRVKGAIRASLEQMRQKNNESEPDWLVELRQEIGAEPVEQALQAGREIAQRLVPPSCPPDP